MKTLIITEKPNVAERLAKSLGNARQHRSGKVRYYEVDGIYVAPAVGHIFTLMEKNKGAWKYPVFDIDWVPSHKASKESAFTKAYLDNIKALAKECDTFINACDYDAEGEVIGYNVIKYGCKTDPLKSNVRRMKFSTLTKQSILKAYQNLEPINKNMAESGITRHILDWYWGINLSRALTIAIRRSRGYTTLSIGRVQGPTLKILTTREKKIKEFTPEDYWELEMTAAKDKTIVTALHEAGRFTEKEKAQQALNNCTKTATVVKVQRRSQKQAAPNPFDLTTLQTEAYKHLRISPKETLEIAQELYTNAYISYPRTSSQQLPEDLDLKGIIEKLSGIKEYLDCTRILLAKQKLKPNNGKKNDPAHPAIHPTGEIPKNLATRQQKIYDLVVRRFFATFGDPAIRETLTADLETGGEIFISKGTCTTEKNWHILYGKYAKFEENELPPLKKGDILDVKKIDVNEKQTQPPKRYTPSSIIREMEKKNIGTKATRSQILDILFKRGYLDGKSIEVTPLGINVVETLDNYCPDVLSERLTRKFEKETDQISEGEISADKVIIEGQKSLKKIAEEFSKSEEDIGKELAKSFRTTKAGSQQTLGDCHKCKGSLVMRKSKFGGHFIGCDNYPECNYTISLPNVKKIKVSGNCPTCGYSKITIMGKKPWTVCINPQCPTKKRG